jgi:hypothetical protein
MKHTYEELQDYYAFRRGFRAFSEMDTKDQTAAKMLINLVYDQIWYKKQWSFSGDRYQLSFVPPLTGTVTGTAGEHEITLGAAINESYSGVKIRGQFILINDRLYQIMRRRSSTVLSIDSPLQSTIAAGTPYTIYFLDYALPPGIGYVRSIKRKDEDVAFYTEFMSELDNGEGADQDYAHLAGLSKEAYLSAGTVTATQNSSELLYSVGSGVSKDHVGKWLLLKKADAYTWYRIVDVDTVGNKWIIDRDYIGTTEASLTFEIEPKGTQLIRFRPFPTTRELVEIKYTFAPIKLIHASDLTFLPSDSPMLAGIDVVATKWEAVGEGNINEVLFSDKKFADSLKILNVRGGNSQNRMYTLHEVNRLRRWPRNTNPWNQGPWGW